MAQQFCGFGAAADAACLLFLTGANTESLHCQLPVVLNWDTAGTGAIAEDTQATVLPAGGVSADTVHYTWLIVVTVGGGLYLIDQGTATTITVVLAAAAITADWAVWGRIVDGKVESYEQ